jgi:hypothetical protein
MNATENANDILINDTPVITMEKPDKKRRGRKPKNTTETVKRRITESGAENTEIHLQTFHFSFSEEITERFAYFASLHRFDERKVFKENWTKWIQEEDVANCIAREIQLLEQSGYTGDIMDKMFKSVRYYYRKKPLTPKEPKQRKQYVALSLDILAKMDMHIIETIVANTDAETNHCGISPAKSFEQYVKQDDVTISEAELPKHKKTYKNRFFIATQNVRALAVAANETNDATAN